MRLYVSQRTRRNMVALALIAMACWLVLMIFTARERPGFLAGVGWTLLQVGLGLFAVTMATARRPDDECSFCRASRSQVRILVAAEAVAICDACAALSVGVSAEDLANRSPPESWERLTLDGLPLRCPVSISGPLLEAAAAKSGDPDTLRALVVVGLRLENHGRVADLLTRIPAAERPARDWLNLACAYGALGRFDEALAAASTALEKDDGALRPWCLNARAWCSVRQRPDAPGPMLEAWLRDLEEAKRLVREKSPLSKTPSDEPTDATKQLLQAFYGTAAEIRRTLGDLQGALQALSEADALGAPTGERLLIRARVLAAGTPPLGRQDAGRALTLLHPDSRDAQEARELLATFGERQG